MKITDAQQRKLTKAGLIHVIRSFFIGVKFGFYFFFLCLAMAALNVYYVKSEDFTFIMGMVNAIFLLHFFLQDTARERNRLRNVVKTIIESEKQS